MKFVLVCIFVSVVTLSVAADRDNFYEALSGNSKELVESLIGEYEQVLDSNSLVNVFKGALYIKRADFLSVPARKLESFKKGRDMLELEILHNPNNSEYRFIRLILQEQTPPMLRYKVNLDEDKQFILSAFPQIDQQLKSRILNYSKSSRVLKFEEFE
jgi:hypothetical protein